MENKEKNVGKEQNNTLLRKYKQYLQLEQSLSSNTVEAYLADVDKLLAYLASEDASYITGVVITIAGGNITI